MKSKVPRSLHSHTTSFAGRGTSAESLDHSRVGFKKSTVRYLSQGHGDSVPGIGNEKVSVTIAQPVVVINEPVELHDKIPVGWSKHFDDNGIPYYFNSATGESQWEHPPNISKITE
mmetsp:Transcript_5373/g.9870  ORF Transcript_5373/g.9870 Transcript_5373/m.9870 type:complete len:116 (-) Transcript_5373:632-979(-)